MIKDPALKASIIEEMEDFNKPSSSNKTYNKNDQPYSMAEVQKLLKERHSKQNPATIPDLVNNDHDNNIIITIFLQNFKMLLFFQNLI